MIKSKVLVSTAAVLSVFVLSTQALAKTAQPTEVRLEEEVLIEIPQTISIDTQTFQATDGTDINTLVRQAVLAAANDKNSEVAKYIKQTKAWLTNGTTIRIDKGPVTLGKITTTAPFSMSPGNFGPTVGGSYLNGTYADCWATYSTEQSVKIDLTSRRDSEVPWGVNVSVRLVVSSQEDKSVCDHFAQTYKLKNPRPVQTGLFRMQISGADLEVM